MRIARWLCGTAGMALLVAVVLLPAGPTAAKDDGPDGPVEVRVIDTHGEPVAGAEVALLGMPCTWTSRNTGTVERAAFVRAVSRPPQPLTTATTDAAGVARVEAAPSGARTVAVTADGYARHVSPWPSSRRARDGLRLVIGPGSRLGGVLRTRSGDPVAGARVVAGPTAMDLHATTALWQHTTTDDAGRYAFTTLRPADTEVWVTAGKDEPRWLARAHAGRVDTLDLDLGRPTRRFGPWFSSSSGPDRGGTRRIRGRVVDDAGTAVAGAFVLPHRKRGERPFYDSEAAGPGAFSGPDGAFELRVDADEAQLVVSAPGRAPRVIPVEEDAGTVRLAAGHDLVVHVVHEGTDIGVPGALLMLTGPPPDGPLPIPAIAAASLRGPTYDARTDDDGRAVIRDLPAGPVHVLVLKPGAEQIVGSGELPADEPLAIEIVSQVVLAGSLVFEDGSPVRAALMCIEYVDAKDGEPRFVRNPRIVTDGAFRFRGLKPGRYRFSVSAHGERQTFVPFETRIVPGGREDIRFVADRGRPLESRIVGPDDEGVLGAEVRVVIPGLVAWELPRASSAPDGTFRFDALGSRPFDLEIRVRGWGDGGRQVLYRRLSGVTNDGKLPIIRVGGEPALSGVLRDADGKPVAGFILDVVPKGADASDRERPWPQVETDAQGRWRIESLDASRSYHVRTVSVARSSFGWAFEPPDIEGGVGLVPPLSDVELTVKPR